MRENYRKPIASLNKFPQFTTMNVIDGQAGLASYSSLIFYSLTIDNILNIIVLLILAGVSIATLTGENGILNQARNAKEKKEIENEKEVVELAATKAAGEDIWGEITEINLRKELDKQIKDQYDISEDEGIIVTYKKSKRSYLVDSNGNVTQLEVRTPVEQPKKGGSTFERMVGTTDIVFLSETSYNEGKANEPEIDTNTMIPIKYNGANWVVTTTTDPDWYNYSTEDVTQPDGTVTEARKWANVMLTDGGYDKNTPEGTVISDESNLGSMFVWIPRYAYKIVYFGSGSTAEDNKQAYVQDRSDKTNIVGYSDARGIVDIDGKVPRDITEDQITSIPVGDNYRPHPVFEKDTEKGGWGKRTKGIWVGKFETTTTKSSKNTNMILPNKIIQTDLKVATMFSRAQEIGIALNMTLDSHLMKNSEWGATTYLAESQYGRNGTEITINNSSSYITGNAGDSVSASKEPGTINAYNTEKGQLASTTGNIYGIYDMSGGASGEHVMGFYKDSNGNIHTGCNGSNTSGFNGYFYNGTEDTSGVNLPEEKYYQTYTSNNSNVLGDAIYETKSWNSDSDVFVESFYPVFIRGSRYSFEHSAGGFSFEYALGRASNFGFRVSLTVK